MMTRSELQQIVDELPKDQVDQSAEVFDASRRGDRVLIQLLTAPAVPPASDELAALAELTGDDRNDVISAEELRSHFGIS